MKYLTKKRILIGLLIVLIIWAGSGIYLYFNFNPSDRSSIGDMFGAINALFSGIALFGIILSIFLQQNALELQKEEIKLTRDEFKHSRLTNILFKTVDYINNRVRSFQFQGYSILGFKEKEDIKQLGIENFNILIKSKVNKLKLEYNNNDSCLSIYDSIKVYIAEILIIFKDISNSIQAFEEVVKITNIDINAKNELIILFKNSLDKDVYELLNSINELPRKYPSLSEFKAKKDYEEHQLLMAELESLQNLSISILKKLN